MEFKEIYAGIVENKKNHEEGYFNCIPFEGMSRLEKFIPGIEQDTYYLLTASSGVKEKKVCIQHLFVVSLQNGNNR